MVVLFCEAEIRLTERLKITQLSDWIRFERRQSGAWGHAFNHTLNCLSVSYVNKRSWQQGNKKREMNEEGSGKRAKHILNHYSQSREQKSFIKQVTEFVSYDLFGIK